MRKAISTSLKPSTSFSASAEAEVATAPASTEPLTARTWVTPTFPDRKPIPRTHGIHVATLTLYAHYPQDLELFSQFAWQSAQSLGIPASRPAPLKRHRELVTVIKSPFIYKKSQENFERRHLRRAIEVYDANPDTVDLWLRYLQQNSIGGIGMRARVHEFVDVGFAKGEMDELETQLEGAMEKDTIAKVAESLLKKLSESEIEEPSEEKVAAAAAESVEAETAQSAETEAAKPAEATEVKVEAAEATEAKVEAAETAEKVEAVQATGKVEAVEPIEQVAAEPTPKAEQVEQVEAAEITKKVEAVEAVDAAPEVVEKVEEVKVEEPKKAAAEAPQPPKRRGRPKKVAAEPKA